MIVTCIDINFIRKNITQGIWWSIVFWDQVTTTSWPVKSVQARATHRRWRSSRIVWETPTELGGVSVGRRWESIIRCFFPKAAKMEDMAGFFLNNIWDEQMSCFLFFYEVYHETKIYSIVQEVKNYGYRETLPNVIIMTKPTKRTERYTKPIQNRCFTLAKYQLLILTHRYLKPYLNLDKKHRTATHSLSSSHFAFQTSGEPDLLRFHSPNRAQWPSWRKGPCVLSWHFRWVHNYKAEL